MNTVAAIAYISVICFICYKAFYKKTRYIPDECDNEESELEQDISYVTLEEYISSLSRLKERLDIVEQMITDIEVCSPDEEIKSIKVSVPNRQGIYNSYTFVINGENDSTSNLLDMFYNERKLLRTSLCKELNNPCYRANENGNANDYVFE